MSHNLVIDMRCPAYTSGSVQPMADVFSVGKPARSLPYFLQRVFGNEPGDVAPKSLVNRVRPETRLPLATVTSLKFPRNCTDRDVIGFVERLKREKSLELKILDLENCEEITDRCLPALEELCQFCPTLQGVSLSGTAVSDAGILGASHLRKLRALDLSNCFNITPVKNGTGLDNVDTSGCGVRLSLGVRDCHGSRCADDDGDICGTADYRTPEIWKGYCEGHYTSPSCPYKWVDPMVEGKSLPTSGRPWSIT